MIFCTQCLNTFHEGCVSHYLEGTRQFWKCSVCRTMPHAVMVMIKEISILKRQVKLLTEDKNKLNRKQGEYKLEISRLKSQLNVNSQQNVKAKSSGIYRETGTQTEPPKNAGNSKKQNSLKPKGKFKKVTLVGDSMVRGTGGIIASKLNCDTCVLSKSGNHINDLTESISSIAKEHARNDIIALQIGTNDVKKSTSLDIKSMYLRLLDKIKSVSHCDVVITALAHRLDAGSAADNQKLDNINQDLRAICAEDERCTFINCNPEPLLENYKYDRLHFNFCGIRFFASTLANEIKSQSNFYIQPQLIKN